ncbi:EAL domain-containing protein [Beggiatoa leptomitoformis]|uniref:cyclic-guanylate-specific phosphodiesterase n=1 Tax=Beggiatoa leptomitoformis TaxID=288004 RepID=A0A2N9YG12_9GAMM|nr:EAL domain-containing protein [Beggiatoa leptomitoformis]AUI69319.1 EAL domain-containing protein [Beggiatoa leptomitoformis]QGX03727.1 EAL domain-containing protein [Beggiatoa leptomitoformis]
MLKFKELSIRYKLTLIMLLSSSIVLLFSSTAFMINDLISIQRAMENDIEVQTNMTAVSISFRVHFDDVEQTTNLLNALSEHNSIVLAQVYKYPETTVFASYQRPSATTLQLIAPHQEHNLVSSVKYLQFSKPLYSPNQDYLGDLVLLADRQPFYDRIKIYTSIALIIIIISAFMAFLLSSRLQHIITAPILKLAKMAQRVSIEKNYALRIDPSPSKDEITFLFNGFNDMLSAIQERDKKLAQHNEHLERTVTNRTAELKKLNLKLTYQAYHDALTNLPNRALFIKRAEQAINHAEQNNEILAMLFIDLDRFKFINDTLGHAAGDRLLQEVSKRLLACTRLPEDTVARLGGDEFTLLLRDIKEPSNAAIVAEYIIKSLTNPLCFHDQELYITPSIGISIFPKDGRDVGTLMKNADAGMYMAKRQGRNNYRFYVHSANAASAARLNMENKLRQALEFEEFEVWYQPRFDIRKGIVVGAEALVRWRSPEFSLVPPAQFIPLAEDTGLIIPIGEWVLRTACQENQRWQRAGEPPLHVSVNLSARQFIQEDLLITIEQIVSDLNMDPHRLELELTESLIMPNAEDTLETLKALKRLGMQLSVDDFGTGYSSLSYLKRFPIDTLKIDQSFIRDLNHDSDDSTLVTAIIAMAQKLRLTVVAEGVETREQLSLLSRYECDYAQGYLCGKPMPATEFRQFLEKPLNLKSLMEDVR